MKKIKSALIGKKPVKHLKETYEQIYHDSSIWQFSKFDGVHSIIWHVIKDKLNNARVLDVGCGAGRLTLYLGLRAKKVMGIDFSKKAIERAKFIQKFVNLPNVEFCVGEINKIHGEKFNVVVFADVLEHVNNPVKTLRLANRLLEDDGVIIFSCPGFMNLRGIIYKTLLNALELPMSLADLRRVNYVDVFSWSKKSGFTVEKIIGGLYSLGWEEEARKDLIERLPKVLKDKPIKEINLNSFNNWLRKEEKLYLDFYRYLLKKYLKKSKIFLKLKLSKSKKIDRYSWDHINKYLTLGFKRDPYFCDVFPFNLWGGETIYLLRKI